MEFHAKASAVQGGVPELHATLDATLNYIAARDAIIADKAMRGFGCDHELLVKILCNRSKPQIAAIDTHYRNLPKNKSHTTLNAAVKSETSGNYGRFMKYVTQKRGDFLAQQLHKAMDGIGCNKKLLNSCFTSSSTEDIHSMQEFYESQHAGKKLADVIRSELGGEHEKLILFLLKNGRPEDPGDPSLAEQQKAELKDMIKKGGTMLGGLKDAAEEAVSKYIAAMSAKQCCEVKKVWDSFEKTIKDKFRGALEEAVLQLMEESDVLAAQQLEKAMVGLGTDEETLSRILGGNHKHVAAQIAATYFRKYDKELSVSLKSEIGGNYLNAVLTWVAGNDATGGMEPTVLYYRKKYDAGLLTPGEQEAYIEVLHTAIENAKDCVASLDADLLKKATRGLGTDERMVVSIMCNRTKSQLDAVDLIYRERYGRTLREYCERELGGDLKEFLVYTQMEEDECDAHMLHSAFKGIGCDKAIIVEIACGRSSTRLAAAKEYYERFYDENLMDRIRSELSGDLKALVVKLFGGCRARTVPTPPTPATFDPAAVAAALYKGGEAKWGTDEALFIDILCDHTHPEMRQIMECYDTTYSNSLERAIKSETSGWLEKGLLSMLTGNIDLYCRLIKEATDGIGCNEATISRILGAHDKKSVHKIAKRYFEKYDVKLVDVLSSELWYDYRKACMAYVETSDITEGMEAKLAEMEISATDEKPKPPSKVPERPAPPPPPARPEPPAAPAEPERGDANAPMEYAYGGPPTQPVVIVYGVMDMGQMGNQNMAQRQRRQEREMRQRARHEEERRERRGRRHGH